MPNPLPAISSSEQTRRQLRVERLAKQMEFVGRVEYQHKLTDSGGAQYRQGSAAKQDQLVVFAEAFDRDSDPNDFSLAAMIAHERGHQLLFRNVVLERMAAASNLVSEEILASLIGSLIVESEFDQLCLYGKAILDAQAGGMELVSADRLLRELRHMLEEVL